MKKGCDILAEDIDLPGSAEDTLKHLEKVVLSAKARGATDMYFSIGQGEDSYSHAGLDLWGVKPPDPEKIAAARMKRFKQYQKLKQEFGE